MGRSSSQSHRARSKICVVQDVREHAVFYLDAVFHLEFICMYVCMYVILENIAVGA
jgi:hypothetical protein